MHVPFVVGHMPHVDFLIITCLSLNLITYSGSLSVLYDQRAIPYHGVPQYKNSCHALVQGLSLTTSHLCYCIPWILALQTNGLVMEMLLTRQVAYNDSLAL